MNTKNILRWIKAEKQIQESSKGRRCVDFARSALHPEMEERLYAEYKELRKKGLKVKGWWFRTSTKQILSEIGPEAAPFSSSDGWFSRFKSRHRISKRRATNCCQREPDDKRGAIQNFHRSIRRAAKEGEQIGPLGRWTARHIANMDQTPLPFIFCSGETYTDTGERSVWVRGGASGLEKRQCTVQLTLFVDGEPRVKPLLIFRGQGKSIALSEQVRYERRVVVKFQQNAWCDGDMMKYWVRQCWKPTCQGSMHLVLDVHRAQTTDDIQSILESECHTICTYVPRGCTSLVQPVDVSFNKPFKGTVEKIANQYMQEHLEEYVHGTISARERRILFTSWVGQAWDEVCADREMIIRSFKKCGIALAIDSSEDEEIHIQGIDSYTVEDDNDDE